MKVGIDPRRSSSVCNFTAALVEQNGAHGNIDRHDPGGICLSEDAYRQVRDRLKEGFADLGEKELKNIARPVRVFAIKTASSGVTQELIASTPELGGDPEQEAGRDRGNAQFVARFQ